MSRTPGKTQTMKTIGVKIPQALWDELEAAVQRVLAEFPNMNYTVSDEVRARLGTQSKTRRQNQVKTNT
jgi:hypothetical protein